MSGLQAPAPGVYRRHRPETTALYEVVRDNLRGRACGEARRRASGGAEGDGGSVNLETLYGAIEGVRLGRALWTQRPGRSRLCRGPRLISG